MSDFKVSAAEFGAVIKNDIGFFKVGAVETYFRQQQYHHLIIYKGFIEPVPVRIQSGCALGHIAGDHDCDCRRQMTMAMKYLQVNDNGLIIYTDQDDGRGRGLVSKVRVYVERQKYGITSEEACSRLGIGYDLRDFGQAAEIIKYLNINKVQLLSSSLEKARSLSQRGISVTLREMEP